MSDGVTIFRGPRVLLAMAAGVSVGLALATAHSAPLPREDCDKLATERTALMAAGIVDQMVKGPAWAKSNLPAAKMTEVERFIAIDEQLSFRCGMSRMKLDIPDEEQAGAEAEAKAKKPGPPVKGAPVPKKASPPKAATVPAAKKPAVSTASAPKAPAPVLKPPAAPRKTPVAPSEPTTAGDAAKKATAASPPPAPPKPKPKPKPKPAEPAAPATDPS